MTSGTRLAAAAAAAVTVLAPLGVVATRVRYAADVPDPLPTHWDLHGRVDDVMATSTLFTATLAVSTLAALLGGVVLVRSRRRPADRMLATSAAWLAWLAAAVFVMPVLAARGAEAAYDVPLTLGWFALVPGLPLLAAAAVWFLLPEAPRPAAEIAAASSSLVLDAGERVTWVGQSTSGRLVVAAGMLLLAAVFVVFTAWPLAAVLAVMALVLFWIHVVTVRVDDRAVTVAWGPARWPRLSVPVEQIEAAREEWIEPLRWGGWGYRASARGTAAITRRGAGLVLERAGRSPLAVTVDRPQEAVDLVHALHERRARPVG